MRAGERGPLPLSPAVSDGPEAPEDPTEAAGPPDRVSTLWGNTTT